jgi:hypothetical protein
MWAAVYNYWEPLHFLLYGKGFQTWEYAPEYAIRSYAYVAGLLQVPLSAKWVVPLDKVRCPWLWLGRFDGKTASRLLWASDCPRADFDCH